MNTNVFEVGQKLATYASGSRYPTIRKIVSVSPTGRATLEGGTIVEPTLKIRGASRWGPSHAYLVTPEIEEQDLRYRLGHKLSHANWYALSLVNLKTIAAILDSEKAEKQTR